MLPQTDEPDVFEYGSCTIIQDFGLALYDGKDKHQALWRIRLSPNVEMVPAGPKTKVRKTSRDGLYFSKPSFAPNSRQLSAVIDDPALTIDFDFAFEEEKLAEISKVRDGSWLWRRKNVIVAAQLGNGPWMPPESHEPGAGLYQLGDDPAEDAFGRSPSDGDFVTLGLAINEESIVQLDSSKIPEYDAARWNRRTGVPKWVYDSALIAEIPAGTLVPPVDFDVSPDIRGTIALGSVSLPGVPSADIVLSQKPEKTLELPDVPPWPHDALGESPATKGSLSDFENSPLPSEASPDSDTRLDSEAPPSHEVPPTPETRPIPEAPAVPHAPTGHDAPPTADAPREPEAPPGSAGPLNPEAGHGAGVVAVAHTEAPQGSETPPVSHLPDYSSRLSVAELPMAPDAVRLYKTTASPMRTPLEASQCQALAPRSIGTTSPSPPPSGQGPETAPLVKSAFAIAHARVVTSNRVMPLRVPPEPGPATPPPIPASPRLTKVMAVPMNEPQPPPRKPAESADGVSGTDRPDDWFKLPVRERVRFFASQLQKK
jgi:hypothetical protein